MIKNNLHKIIIYTAISIFLILGPASAGSRYGTPPPIVLSPDLTAPWVLQLRTSPALQHQQSRNKRAERYQVQLAKPARRGRSLIQTTNNREIYRRTTPIFSLWGLRQNTRGHNVPKIRQVAFQNPSSIGPPSSPSRKQKSSKQMDSKFEPQLVSYDTHKPAGTVIIDTTEKFLYLVLGNGQARRYGVGVGKPGFEWAGTHKISRKAEWPDWRPPAQMIAREKKKGRVLPAFVEGGPQNPLGARALYLGSSLYRIHGTNQPWTIGKAVSSGCIRMRNEDVMDLYERIGVGTKVVVS